MPTEATKAIRKKLRGWRWKIHKYAPTMYKLRRRFVERCENCGQHARWVESWHTHGNRDGKVWHGPCIAYETWRNTADERLAIVGLIAEVWGIVSTEVEQIAELRQDEYTGRGEYRDLAWRVFYALDQQQKAPS